MPQVNLAHAESVRRQDPKREYCLQLEAGGTFPNAPACRVWERLCQCLEYVLQVRGAGPSLAGFGRRCGSYCPFPLARVAGCAVLKESHRSPAACAVQASARVCWSPANARPPSALPPPALRCRRWRRAASRRRRACPQTCCSRSSAWPTSSASWASTLATAWRGCPPWC